MKKIFDLIIKATKKLNEITINIINFFLLLVIYFLGVGLSNLFWRAFGKRKINTEKNSYWLKSKELPKKLESYKEQY